ncbi:SPOR domain-containing protein [Massilia sp. RP-1-19]|uniref:SPOR domain-containing protein n=1 Tax=Massilia polaris TaxID=2728846 RepID=A0A848HQC6_9BURK|nr:SPOR domain-containing protein [Massilia polaris]NML62350.1 SPOR domain-containing protein [Massilia polaris]
MGLFSNSSKNKQETTAEDSGFYTSPDDAVSAEARSKRASNAGAPAPRRARAKAGADPILPEKKRARRRLVGAIALALAVAVGLPMLLDAEPKPLSSDIDIRIPSKDRPAALLAEAPVPAADTLDAREEIVDAPAAPVQRDVARVEVAPARPDMKMLPKEDKPAEEKLMPAAKPVEKAVAKKIEEKPAVKAERPADAARAIAILEDKPVGAAGQKFVVQVASLASQEKVDELRAKLRAEGISSFTEKVKTKEGELIRVRVGPSSKEDADKTRARLGKLGLGGSVVPA